MKVKEILKKDNYNTLVYKLMYNPESLDKDTIGKINNIEAIFKNVSLLTYKNYAIYIVWSNSKRLKTMEEIAEQLHISVRQAYRLRDVGIELIEQILE